ncbi:MAG: hypothetical protein ACFFB0_13545 [Promethearchaeota archaeon]
MKEVTKILKGNINKLVDLINEFLRKNADKNAELVSVANFGDRKYLAFLQYDV